MKPGDIIPVDMPEFVQVYLEDLPTYRAQMGQRSGKVALKITHKLQRPETVKTEMHFLTRKGVRIDSEADLEELEEDIMDVNPVPSEQEGIRVMSEEDDAADAWAAALEEAEQAGQQGGDADNALGAEEVQATELEELNDENAPITKEERRKLDTILDIPVTISMEVGRAHIPIRNLLQLNQGSVVELERIAGESLDVLVNGTLIAHGEVVVVNDKFGIRLTDVISQVERIKKLK